MNIIVTTTINKPTKAILRFANLKSWHLIVVVDKKTPLQNFKRLKNITLLKCEDQKKISSKLSKLIGWNSIQRRNFGFIEAKKLGAKIVATVDDDNIPYNNWGVNISFNKTKVRKFDEKNLVFNPLKPFKHFNKIWHRGYPIELVQNDNYNINYKVKYENFDVRADLWNGNPDIDTINRLNLKGIKVYWDTMQFLLLK